MHAHLRPTGQHRRAHGQQIVAGVQLDHQVAGVCHLLRQQLGQAICNGLWGGCAFGSGGGNAKHGKVSGVVAGRVAKGVAERVQPRQAASVP